ncbi:Sodium/calcium exchanger protein-domain-containing protein [Gymnopilus junonius]|uniref:Sodium/calcium exchanger protein-domain-containing protein n=1 Tax=Gymnopilus junonius TaxID=109634 RepID=A0A9P5NK99_GYMJU|nr:Sodium/calcium exchanger protein-domain-containing protein [Gymnopilus junonius]
MGSSAEGYIPNGHASPVANTTAREQPELAQRNNSIPTTAPSSRFELIRQRTTMMLTPPKKVGTPPSFFASLKSIITASWLNLLLVCIPISWVLHFALPQSFANRDTLIFVFSFLAIIPLAKLLGFATEELSLRVGQTLAGLLNATLGNAVELIVAIIALVKCELQVVQASLVGSILSNLLLVLGMCFFAGGLKYSEQGFGVSASQLNSSLLTISVIAVLLPAAFHINADPTLSDQQEGHDILAVSHGVAVILLFIYAGYLSFQLYSHAALYDDKNNAFKTTNYASPKFRMHIPKRLKYHSKDVEGGNLESPAPVVGLESVESSQTLPTPQTRLQDIHAPIDEREEEEEETPMLSLYMTIALLVAVTVLVAITAEWLVDSIGGLTDTGNISKEFVGVILLPIVGNAAEHVTAVSVSVKDKLNLSLSVAVGSSIQIALFVIPFIVILGWILGKPLTLLFDPYESIAMFLTVLTVNYVVQDGKSNWLEGFILMCLYVILAVTFWFYPGSDPSGVLASCH